MAYAISLIALGLLLIGWAGSLAGWFWVLAWLGMNMVALGLAHATGFHQLYGKKPDGTLPFSTKLLHFPFLLFAWVTWQLYRITSHEAAWNEVTKDLVIGRRLLANENPDDFTNYIDLTSEFDEPPTHRRRSGYKCVGMLDGSTAKADVLLTALKALPPGRTYIHCAQGHGRTGVFAIAYLLFRGEAKSVDEALKMLKAARPKVQLNRQQRTVAEAFAALLK